RDAGRQQADDGQRQQRLARARLADDAERGAIGKVEGHVLDETLAANKSDEEILDRERHRRASRRGSNRSRNPSPSRLKPSTASAMVPPGTMASQGAPSR